MTQNGATVEFPVDQVREQFPALTRTYKNKPAVYFDGPGGSQAVRSAIEAIAAYMSRGGANLHGSFPTSRETEEHIWEARQAAADLLGAEPKEVAFGANMTTLTFAIARALGRSWGKDDEIVVTELDHRANVDPWLSVARDLGMSVRWIKVNPETLTLDLSDLNSIITKKTRLAAIGLASNAVGTVNDLRSIAARARETGALVAVDAVHAAPHFSIDRDELGADILLCSSYKFFGPHIGIAVIRSGLFEELTLYKLEPAPSFIPDKLETGTQNHEGIAGIAAAVEFIAELGTGATRRERIVSAFERIEEYENRLAEKLRKEMSGLPGVTLYQAGSSVRKTPTVAFRIEGFTPQYVCEWMAEEHSIFVADGNFYASTLADILGINESGGWIRVGLAPYNTMDEVNRFIEALQQLVTR